MVLTRPGAMLLGWIGAKRRGGADWLGRLQARCSGDTGVAWFGPLHSQAR